MAKFECPHCSQKIDAPEELAGTATNCPACGEAITVPALSQKAEPPPLPPQPRVYVSHKGKTWGPYDTATLQQHVDDRKFFPTDLANVVGSDNWQPLSTIASFPVEPQQVVVHQQKEKKKTGCVTWGVLAIAILFAIGVIKSCPDISNSGVGNAPSTGDYNTSNSAWDSSVPCIVKYLEGTLNDPSSYKSYKWSAVQENGDGTYSVTHEYGAKNGFGAMRRETKKFTYSASGRVIAADPAYFRD